ncbi:MAG: zf-HC2 domain-containing protein [Eubacteriales bacterium]|nr:zf-HC2 domain-containing protein [Eubacteriales bacterium]
MDCITFSKQINAYLKNEQRDEELNEFLRHLNSCPKCREELEINYIVTKGLELIDVPDGKYNLIESFGNEVDANKGFIKNRKRSIRVRYVIDTLVFWAVAFSLLYFLTTIL